jgi:hypothetical protein
MLALSRQQLIENIGDNGIDGVSLGRNGLSDALINVVEVERVCRRSKI